ncbi:hypothetical protein BST61_g2225 [Cercospora zeina]
MAPNQHMQADGHATTLSTSIKSQSRSLQTPNVPHTVRSSHFTTRREKALNVDVFDLLVASATPQLRVQVMRTKVSQLHSSRKLGLDLLNIVLSRQDNTPVARGYAIVNGVFRKDGVSHHDNEQQSDMVSALALMTRQRSLCVTENGRLALVAYTSQPGDKITMLFGGQVLYVLRPKSGRTMVFEYIGEAYVHVMMDGAVAEMIGRGQVAAQKIVIERLVRK